MSLAQIREDLTHLAGRLPHRSAQSEQERHAAHYIHARLSQSVPDASMESFEAPEHHGLLFASYLAEFMFVGLLSLLWPSAAFGYGLGVFALYLMELCGYRGLSRFLPQYPSQNVVAALPGRRPARTVVVHAHYDSGCATAMTRRDLLKWLRPLHTLILACMTVTVATCAATAFVPEESLAADLAFGIRALAIVLLLCAALLMYWSASRGEDIRGASHNASGVAALLGLAERFAAQPEEGIDLYLAATGSHEAWMAGLRHLLSGGMFRKADTWFINLEGVGAGTLHFLSREGFVHALAADRTLVEAARRLATGRPVREGSLRAIPTASHVPLMRGMKAMTLMGLERDNLPTYWNSAEDRLGDVEEASVAEAIEFCELLIRDLARGAARD